MYYSKETVEQTNGKVKTKNIFRQLNNFKESFRIANRNPLYFHVQNVHILDIGNITKNKSCLYINNITLE